MLRRIFPQVALIVNRPAVAFCTSKQQMGKANNENESTSASSFVISHDGDGGETKILSGVTLKKNHPLLDAIGTAEELNAQIGMARVFARDNNHPYTEHLKRIQTVLIDLASIISKSPTEAEIDLHSHVKELEEWIEAYVQQLPAVDDERLDCHVVPGGSHASAALQVARSVCRRSERTVNSLAEEQMLNREIQIYLNRLGDFLFVLSRLATKLDERTELVYIPKPVKK